MMVLPIDEKIKEELLPYANEWNVVMHQTIIHPIYKTKTLSTNTNRDPFLLRQS